MSIRRHIPACLAFTAHYENLACGGGRITDELGRDYTFAYGFNHMKRYLLVKDVWEAIYTRSGMPRLSTRVRLPDGGVTTFNTVRDAVIRWQAAHPRARAVGVLLLPCHVAHLRGRGVLR